MGKQAEHAFRVQAVLRRHAGFLVANALFAGLFVALVLSAFHAPSPRNLPVGIVAPAAVTGRVDDALGRAAPGGFDLRVYPSEAAARAGVAHNELDGALIASPGHLRLLIARAGGSAPAQTLVTAFGAVAARSGQPLTVTDVVPPLASDSLALSPFFVILAVLIPSVAAGSASAMVFRRSRPAWSVAAPVVVAVVIGAVAAGIADGVAGLGHYPAVAAIIALFSLAVAAPTAALGRIWPPLVAAAVGVFIVFGIPVSGGPSGLASFGPGFLRALHPALPLGVAASAVRGAVYFGGYGTAGPLWTLAAWAVAGMAALVVVTALRRHRPAARVPLRADVRTPALATAGGNGQFRPVVLHVAGGDQLIREAAGSPGAVTTGLTTATAQATAVADRPEAPGQEPLAPAGVVVGFDNSEPARRALRRATRLLASRPGILHIVYADHVVVDSDLTGFAHEEMEQARDSEAAKVAEAAAGIVAPAGIRYTFERREGAPASVILSAASALAAAPDGRDPVIVVGRSGHTVHHILGSVPAHLLHHSPYPVLAIP